jgi:hypothetical protein
VKTYPFGYLSEYLSIYMGMVRWNHCVQAIEATKLTCLTFKAKSAFRKAGSLFWTTGPHLNLTVHNLLVIVSKRFLLMTFSSRQSTVVLWIFPCLGHLDGLLKMLLTLYFNFIILQDGLINTHRNKPQYLVHISHDQKML